MRDPIENISQLQKQINELQLENQILKGILDKSGISYSRELGNMKMPEISEVYDENQGARIQRRNNDFGGDGKACWRGI